MMSSYVVLYDHRGVLIGHGLIPNWPHPHSAETAPVIRSLGLQFCRTEEWEEHGGKNCRVYIALQDVNLVAP